MTTTSKSIKKKPASRHRGTLFLLIGPSQVGKDTILHRLLRMRSLDLHRVVTTTTRSPRPGEIPGQTYVYVNEKEFDAMRRRGDLLEWASVQTHHSGTPRQPLMSWLAQGHNALQHIDVKGADTLMKRSDMKVVAIFVLPRSVEELRRRFLRRPFSRQERAVRWATTLNELQQQSKYDFRVVNAEGRLREAVEEVAQIIRSIR